MFNRAICVGSDVLDHLDVSSRTSHDIPVVAAEKGGTCSRKLGQPDDLTDPQLDQIAVPGTGYWTGNMAVLLLFFQWSLKVRQLKSSKAVFS